MGEGDVQPAIGDATAAEVNEVQAVVRIHEHVAVAQVAVREHRILVGQVRLQVREQGLRRVQAWPLREVVVGVDQVAGQQVVQLAQPHRGARVERAVRDRHGLQLSQRFAEQAGDRQARAEAGGQGHAGHRARDHEFLALVLGHRHDLGNGQLAREPVQHARLAPHAVRGRRMDGGADLQEEAFAAAPERMHATGRFADRIRQQRRAGDDLPDRGRQGVVHGLRAWWCGRSMRSAGRVPPGSAGGTRWRARKGARIGTTRVRRRARMRRARQSFGGVGVEKAMALAPMIGPVFALPCT